MLWGACLRVPMLGLGKAACVGPRPATITISPGHICFVTRKRLHRANIIAASAMAIKSTWFQGWQ